jgi:hypothetical protein
MHYTENETLITDEKISKEMLISLAESRFGDMVKGVIDIETGTLALGGELHADQEALLLQKGHNQESLWGFNIYISEAFPENIEFDSMINIRPRQNNRSRTIEDPKIQEAILSHLKKVLQ